jgi:hypothetical protein
LTPLYSTTSVLKHRTCFCLRSFLRHGYISCIAALMRFLPPPNDLVLFITAAEDVTLVVGNYNPPLQCGAHGLRTVTHVEFGEDADGVIANGVFAVSEYCGDFAIREPRDQKF